MKILFLLLLWLNLALANEDPYLENLIHKYPYVRQLVVNPLAQWPNHDLGGVAIDWEGANGIAYAIGQNAHLKSLAFKYCELTDLTVKPILLSLVGNPFMEKIDLSSNRFGKETFKLLSRVIQNNFVLKSLDLTMAHGTADGDDNLFESVLKSSNIKEFIYDFNLFHEDMWQAWTKLNEVNQSLERLSLRSTCLFPSALKEMANGIVHLKALKYLNLSMNHLGNEDCPAIAQLAYNCPSLEELVLTDNKIDGRFFQQFDKHWKAFPGTIWKRGSKPLKIYVSWRPSSRGDISKDWQEISSGPRVVWIF